jgi:hypothetical protein
MRRFEDLRERLVFRKSIFELKGVFFPLLVLNWT